MKKSNLFLFTLIGFLSIPLVAFSLPAFREPYTDYEIICGREGGDLVISITSDPKSFNPIVAQETSTTAITRYIFEGLTRTHPLTLEVIPSLAKKWEMLDEKTWIFHLRDDVFWNDGEKFTARDVVFTFQELIYNPDIPTSSKDIFTIEDKQIEVTALDDYTVKFTLPFSFAPFLRSLSHDILPFHKYASLVKEDKFPFSLGLDSKPTDIVGTGPFRITKYLPGERIVLVKNPLYYKRDDCGVKLPYIDKIFITILSNQDTALLKFLEGEIDYYGIRPHDLSILGPKQEEGNFTNYNSGPAFGSSFVVLNQTEGINPNTGESFVLPYKLKWFKNKDFRQAISYAIDREKIIKILMNNLGVTQYSPVSPANVAFYSDKIKKYPHDPKKAKGILTSIGFSDRDGDGILEDKDNNKLELSFFTTANDPQRGQIATLIKKDLEFLGFKVYFRPLVFNNLVTKLTATYDWEMILISLTGGIEPYFGKNVWSYKGNLHMWNTTGKPLGDYEIEIEDIFNKAARELNEEKRKELFGRWQQIVAEQLPLIYTVVPYSIYAVRNRFGNLYPTAYGGAFSEIEYIYIKE